MERTFTFDDQIAFCKLSGDNNPLHIDPVAVRRYLFGQPVVHGIHAVLWALDVWLSRQDAPLGLLSLKVSFRRPIRLDSVVRCSIDRDGQPAKISLICDGSVAITIAIKRAASDGAEDICFGEAFPELHSPQPLSEQEIEGKSGTLNLYFSKEAIETRFSHLARCVPAAQIASLLGTTRLVGVECPGLHSVYVELELVANHSCRQAHLDYRVVDLDRRFHLATIAITVPGMSGTIKAIVRPPPQSQASYALLRHCVERGEFAGQRALVIGGSRGLGEVTAKLLCAGGGEAMVTYFQGQEDARRVVQEIAAGGGVANYCHCNVLQSKGNLVNSLGDWRPTHLYYFATPNIFGVSSATFSAQHFRAFCDYYVVGFAGVMEYLQPLGLQGVFYPSTVALDEPPLNMGEYTAAKTAGESLCAFLERKFRGVKIYRPRLPRMATDQTANVLGIDSSDPSHEIITQLRRFRKYLTGDQTRALDVGKQVRSVETERGIITSATIC